MANASCATCTLISNVLTLAGSVSGTVLVGMTITAASVPAGVTITSNGTGSGGVGTYNCSASAANITVAEAMKFSLSWDMPLQGNSGFPQLADLGRAAGFGLLIAAAVEGGTAGPGAQYTFGTHAQQMYAQNTLSTQVFRPSPGIESSKSVTQTITTLPQYVDPPQPIFSLPAYTPPLGMQAAQYTFGTHAKAIYDSQIQAQVWGPVVTESKGFFGAQYEFGTHQKALYDSQIQAQVFKPIVRPLVAADLVPLRSFHTLPQEISFDLTLQGWSKTVPVAQGFLVTMITAGPQLTDLTLSATITNSQPFHSLAPSAPVNPGFFFAQEQFNPTQVPGRVIRPPGRVAAFAPIPQIFGGPSPSDQLAQQQIQPQLNAGALPGPSKKVQPAIIFVFEQQYDKNAYPMVFTTPLVYIAPVIPPPVIGLPDISVWTTDSSSITADSIAFTCDGADLINGGATQVPGLAGRPTYAVSSPNFTPPLPGAALTNNVPLPVTSPPMVYYINGVAYRSGQPI